MPTSIDQQALDAATRLQNGSDPTSSAARDFRVEPPRPLTEEDSHREHHAALEATLFKGRGTDDEVVLVLDDGELRFPPRAR
jgi:hypothetical protein